jgi:hypothetical protein
VNLISDHDAALCSEHFKGDLFLTALKKTGFLLNDEISLSDMGKMGCCLKADGTVEVELRISKINF